MVIVTSSELDVVGGRKSSTNEKQMLHAYLL